MVITYIGEVVPGSLEAASAVEVFHSRVYIAGDNLNWLYLYTTRFYLLNKIPLTAKFSKKPLPKKLKSDWEAMSIITHGGAEPVLLIAGSGSVKVTRDKAMLLDLHTNKVAEVPHWPAFYNLVRAKLNTDDELNIEGLAQVGDKLILLNRGSNKTRNFIGIVDAAVAHQPIVDITIIDSTPQAILGAKAGYTGACYVEEIDTLFYTCAAEDTDNAYDDGKVVGSAIGYFANISKRLHEAVLVPDGQVALNSFNIFGKVESLALLRKSNNRYVFLAVTDNDNQPGSLYQLILEI